VHCQQIFSAHHVALDFVSPQIWFVSALIRNSATG
jgi:hypothetical protein